MPLYILTKGCFVLLKIKVITQLLEGDQISVIADGYLADSKGESSFYLADGYTSLTGLLIKSGLEKIINFH